jgi:pimeloyl-ACP methyl ester carboxylesterase
MKAWGLRLVVSICCLTLLAASHAQGLRLTAPLRTTNGLSLKWTNSVAGQAYTLQSRNQVTNSLWLTLDATQPWPTMQTQWDETISSNQSARFYRVIAVPPATRGKLLSSNLLATYTTTQLNTIFASYGIPLTAQYGVKVYKLVYETIDPLGGRTQASGGQFLPQGVGKGLPLLSWQHGTTTMTNDVASRLNYGDSDLGLVFASAGYATVLPDYLGMGDSPGSHPYVHARSEATAGVDMLRAARRYCASNSIALNGQIFLAGYSQGGHATMALHRELEKYHTNEFTITASAPMAGPYDMSGVELSDMLSARCPPNPYYYAYVVTAYQRVYGLAANWSSVFASPYNTTIPPLFNGNTDGSVIDGSLPACNLSSILTPALRSALQNDPDCLFRQALRDNDVDQWKPLAPMHMFHCAADADVPYANSQVAYSNFLARGASQVQFIDPLPSGNHDTCALPSLAGAKSWFDSLKQ